MDKTESGKATKVRAPKYTPIKHPNTKATARDQRIYVQKKWIRAASDAAAKADWSGIAADTGSTQTLASSMMYTPPVAKAALTNDATKLASVMTTTAKSTNPHIL